MHGLTFYLFSVYWPQFFPCLLAQFLGSARLFKFSKGVHYTSSVTKRKDQGTKSISYNLLQVPSVGWRCHCSAVSLLVHYNMDTHVVSKVFICLRRNINSCIYEIYKVHTYMYNYSSIYSVLLILPNNFLNNFVIIFYLSIYLFY